jgi:Clp amino terminal domain, pathogenicity island component
VFERFTERARQVVVLAQQEARSLRHNHIGTEHILLGLLREEEGLAARVLADLDVTIDGARTRLTQIVASGVEADERQIPFTPRSKRVIELSLREALALGHNHIATEHILLALVREEEGVAARILLDFDADASTVRNAVIHTLSGKGGRRDAGALVARVPGDPETVDSRPGLHWERAEVNWSPDGPALVVPLKLEQRGVALLANSPVWRNAMLTGVQHEVSEGELRLSDPTLLEAIDPRELRRVLDDAVAAAHQESMRARGREAALAQTFLAALQEQPAQ